MAEPINRNNRLKSLFQTKSDYFIIKEVYENGSASEYFENQLECALEARIKTIIIEPTQLGKETSRWISIGNWLQRMSVCSSFSCILCGVLLPSRQSVYLSFGFTSCFFAGIHMVSWQLDPCFCYQIEKDAKKLQSLQTLDLSTSDPVVLVLGNNRLRQYLQLTVVLSASAYCGWKIYESYFG